MKMTKYFFPARFYAAFFLICCMGIFLPAELLANTVAYWQMDETTGSSALQDAVGSYSFSQSVSATQTDPFFAIVPNPDAGPFSIGSPATNPAALNSSHGGRPSYEATFDMRTSPWTLEGWFRNSSNSTAEVLVATRNSSAGYKGWDLTMINGTMRLLAAADSGSSVTLTTAGRYDDGSWHHVAVEWDPDTGANGWLLLYIDGVLVCNSGGAGDLGDGGALKRFAIGGQMTSVGSFSAAWQGDMDEFRFSDALLDPTEFLRARPAPATLAYWQMDETTGASVIQDAVGSNNLTLAVSTTQTQPAITNIPNPDAGPFSIGDPTTNTAALSQSHGAQSAYNETFDMRTSPWTLEGWFRNSANSTAEVLAASRNSSASYTGWDLTMISGELRVYAAADSGSATSFTTTNRYDDGVWHHVAVEWDPESGTNGWMWLYVDGTLVDDSSGVGDLGDGGGLRRFAIGGQVRTTGTVNAPWQGDMDEFRFSNSILDPTNFLCAVYTPPPEGAVIWDLSAAYRNGQVFIQWSESATNSENFRVYMYTEPITSNNFSEAQLVEQRIEPHSANDWYEDSDECPLAAGPARGWILEDGADAIGRTGGLFVHTVEDSDPANAFFAVLADSQGGTNLVEGQNSMTSSVAMAVAPVSAIWQLGSETVPSGSGKPLSLYLHSHQGRPSGTLTYLVFGDKTMGWREGLPFKFKVSVLSNTVLVEPYDRVWINRKLSSSETYIDYNTLYKNIETWHYGTSDKIYDPVLRYEGTVVNYTERLNLWELDWIQQTYQTDTNKVYAYGASMGTGVQRLAMQNPDRFASVDLLVPLVDWSYVSGSENNAKRLEGCCGPMTMMTSDGVALSNRMNLVEFMQNTTRDLPHVIIRVGRTDTSVFWNRKPAYMAAMQANRQGLIAGWDNGTHSTAMRSSISAFPNFRDYDYASSHFALNKSYPAFSNFSMNEDPGNGDPTDGDIVGFINRGLEWSDIVDQDDLYEVAIQVTHPDVVYPVTVDVTLRNLQNFNPAPGRVFHIENRNGSGEIIEEKDVTADVNGLVTCEAFTVTSAQGNTLVVTGRDSWLFSIIGR